MADTECAFYDDSKEVIMDLEEDPGYRRVDRETVELIGVITKAELVYNEEEEVVDMCEAIRQMLLEASEKGITQGLSQGLSQGELLGSYQTLSTSERPQRRLINTSQPVTTGQRRKSGRS